MKIISNYHKIPIICWFELSEHERKEFDYLDDDDKRDGTMFFRYRDKMEFIRQ